MTFGGEIKPWMRRLLALPHAHDRLQREELVPKATESGRGAGVKGQVAPSRAGEVGVSARSTEKPGTNAGW